MAEAKEVVKPASLTAATLVLTSGILAGVPIKTFDGLKKYATERLRTTHDDLSNELRIRVTSYSVTNIVG